MECEPDLLEIIDALRAASGFTGGLHGWQEKSDENRDDRDDDEEFNECEPGTTVLSRRTDRIALHHGLLSTSVSGRKDEMEM